VGNGDAVYDIPNRVHSPDDQRFTTKMKDMLMAMAPAGSFGTLAALLMPYMDRSIYDVTQAMVSIDDVEIKQKNKGVCSMQFAGAKVGKGGKEKAGYNKKHTLKGPVKVSCHIMWSDLIAAEVDIDGQSTTMLFALWKDLSTEQKYTKSKEGQTSRKVKTQMLTLQDLLSKD
jgi:hypothetical protein